MSNVHEQLLAEALDLMESGLSVEEIVSRYPAQAAELRPFLLTAAALSSLATQPTVSAESRSKQALLAAAVERPARAAARDAAGRRPRRLLAPALAVLVVIFLGGAGLAGASGSAVPGDALYSAKRLIEETRLNLTTNPERAAALREQFRQERLEEIEQLLATGRSAEVSLVGEVESLAPMIVAGIPITLSADTVMEGTPNVGDEVRVDGRTDNGAVLAERIVVLSGRVAEPERDEQPEAPPATAEPAAENDNENGDNANGNDYDSSMPGAGVTATSPPPQATLTPAATPSPSATPTWSLPSPSSPTSLSTTPAASSLASATAWWRRWGDRPRAPTRPDAARRQRGATAGSSLTASSSTPSLPTTGIRRSTTGCIAAQTTSASCAGAPSSIRAFSARA